MKSCDMNKSLKSVIREELITMLSEIAIPCGKCGKECPCGDDCDSPNPSGFKLPSGKTILMGGEGGCNCGENETPQMPANELTQFGNTPPLNGQRGPSGPNGTPGPEGYSGSSGIHPS